MIRNIIYYIFFRLFKLYYLFFRLFNYSTFKECQIMCFVLDKNENMINEINDISENTRLKDLLILYDNKKEESMYIRIDKDDNVIEINIR